MNWVKNWILQKLEEKGFYRIKDLVIGGNCGCCGQWIPDEIFSQSWTWGLCKNCKEV